jgi:hypothetical protein
MKKQQNHRLQWELQKTGKFSGHSAAGRTLLSFSLLGISSLYLFLFIFSLSLFILSLSFFSLFLFISLDRLFSLAHPRS